MSTTDAGPPDDPFDWSIERVVQEFCSNPEPAWSRSTVPPRLPAPALLEQALRDNDIDGEVLLSIDMQVLKDDLGIKSLGQRQAIYKAIRYLQQQSAKYRSHVIHDQRPRATTDLPRDFVPQQDPYLPHSTNLRTLPFLSPGVSSWIENSITTLGAQSDPYRTPVNPLPANNASVNFFPDPRTRFSRESDFPLSSDEQKPPPDWDLSATSRGKKGAGEEGLESINRSTRLEIKIGSGEGVSSGEPDNTGVANTKESFNVADEASGKIFKATGNELASNKKAARYTLVGGRKRIAPEFVSHLSGGKSRPKVGSDILSADNSAKNDIAQDFFFLGGKLLSAENVFYPNETLDQDTDISLNGTDYPSGQRQFVARMMRRYLRQPTQKLPDSKAVARIPYSRSILPSDKHPQYCTIFSPGLEPMKFNAADWSALRYKRLNESARHSRASKRTAVAVHDPFIGASGIKLTSDDTVFDHLLTTRPSENESERIFTSYSESGAEWDIDAFYDDLLRRHAPSENDVLTEYGHSGDEAECDDETWKEIQQDIEEDKRMEQNQTRGAMSHAEIALTIDEATAEMQALWYEKKSPKVQMKGYRKWLKADRQGTQLVELDDARFWIQRYDRTTRKMRDIILQDTWYKPADVKQQCQSLEESLSQREEHRYYAKILNETSPPTRPSLELVRMKRSTERPAILEGEEVLESDSDVSLGDFVVEDSSDVETVQHDAAARNEGASFATAENADVMDLEVAEMSEIDPTTAPVAVPRAEVSNQSTAKMDLMSAESEDDVLSPSARRLRSRKAKSDAKKDIAERLVPLEQEADVRGPKIESSSDISLADAAEQNSNISALPQLPKSRFSTLGINEFAPVDLTLSSSPSAREHTDQGSITDFTVHTPLLNSVDASTPTTRRIRFTGPKQAPSTPQNKISRRLVLHLSSHSSDESVLPPLHDVQALQKIDWDVLEERECNRRIVAKAIYVSGHVGVTELHQYLLYLTHKRKILQDSLRAGIPSIHDSEKRVEGVPLKYAFVVRRLALLFASYVHKKNLMDEDDISQVALNESFTMLDQASAKFEQTLRLAIGYYNEFSSDHTREGAHEKHEPKIRQNELGEATNNLMQGSDNENADDDDEIRQAGGGQSSIKKRKRAVKESEEALNWQLGDKLRVQEQELRKAQTMKKLQAMETTGSAAHAVTFSEPVIFLDPHIGQRVKPHQLAGIQFMWRELIADPKQQGCLLAHTMGLGKTMQVISVLVTIAQSSKSSDPEIRKQIPQSMRQTKALILCPPSLIENWYDELIMWRPDDKILGSLRRITSIGKAVRLWEISSWSNDGGILIISYETFRSLILNPAKKLNDEDHNRVLRELLEGPNIIIADEAHKMKNAGSKITQVAKRFRSLSRIALTGSPLANNLEEYHTMIDWIAPGYLGDIVQFRDKYAEPISYGLYADSSSSERRTSLRKLHVLKRDLDPKISRADISAIEKDMPPKTEFFITFPLTSMQKKAYNLYVDHLLGISENGKRGNAKLWDWLAVLSLLLNHPSCFVSKLQDRKWISEGEKSTSNKSNAIASTDDVEGDAMPSDVVLSEVGLSKDMIEQLLKIFQKLDDNDTIGEVKHSYRALMLSHIVNQSLKIGDKVLIFTHSIPTLNYLEEMLGQLCRVHRIDGTTQMMKRQETVKDFNKKSSEAKVFLISMKAGGLGLNLQGANRVVIYDFGFNPSWEEQSIGRAYRLGQEKPVYVYRFKAGGTFEDVVHNKAVFKTQLKASVVDKKNYLSQASKTITDYLFPVRDVKQQDIAQYLGKDPAVLDAVIKSSNWIRNIELTETFQTEDQGATLTPEDVKEAEDEYDLAQLMRNDPAAYDLKIAILKKAKEGLKQTPAGITATPRPAAHASMMMPTGNSSIARPAFPSGDFRFVASQPSPSMSNHTRPAGSISSGTTSKASHLSPQQNTAVSSSTPRDRLPTSISRPETQKNPQQIEGTLLDSRPPHFHQSLMHPTMSTSEHNVENSEPYLVPVRSFSEEPLRRSPQLDGPSDKPHSWEIMSQDDGDADDIALSPGRTGIFSPQ